MKPRLAYRVDNKLSDDNTQMAVELKFNSLDDFEPEQVVRQVEPLRKLLETRLQLQALLAKMDGNDKLTDKLQEIISNTDMLKKIGSEVGAGDGGKEDRPNG
jgi:type VI secretion system protein ImpB